MKDFNYEDLLCKQKEIERLLKKVCPKICEKSGIYFYTREDSDGKSFYIGKAVNLLERNITHTLSRKQHIDNSIKKYGFYSEENKIGWKLNVLFFPREQLDEKERYYIDLYVKSGAYSYNIESGGTEGKTIIGERKEGRGYNDGKAYGKEQLRKEIATLFEKYLDFSIKEPYNKIKQRKFDEFKKLIKGEKDD